MSDSFISAETRALEAVIAPLTEREERAAVDAATASLRTSLSDHYRIAGAELRIDKPREPGTVPGRVVGVYVVDYHNHRSIEVLVDARCEVIAVCNIPPYQIPISFEEVREAQSIAARDERVADALSRHDVSFVAPFAPHDHTSRKRTIGLHYFRRDKARPGSPRPIGDVVVDLGVRTATFTAIEAEDE